MTATIAHLHDMPVRLTACCFAISCAVVFLTDPLALPREVHRQKRMERSWFRWFAENAARVPIIALIFMAFFAISWRPVYAAQATMSFFIIFTGISRAKFIFIREPLIFSDIALVVDVFKYKTIFYATSLNIVFWIVAFAYVFGASALYMYYEPHILPDRSRPFWITVMVLAAALPWLAIFLKPVSRIVARCSEWLFMTFDARLNTVRFGTFTSVVIHFTIWLGAKREKILAEIRHGLQHALHELHELIGVEDEAAPLIVIWQSESFMDLRNFGETDFHLPNIDRMRRHAVQWGRMTSVFEGGYTLRTEFAVLSGLQPESVHSDASYPYLRAAYYSDVVWPTKLKKAGWRTHFIHPYDRTFFLRHKAMPLLGFEKMTMLDEFEHDAQLDGPYVSDMNLTKKVLGIAAEADVNTPALLFVASMANHGPWEPGRVRGLNDPVAIYKQLLVEADKALGRLIGELDKLDRPVWLAFYGDHAPLLKAFADPFPDPRTDYIITPLAEARTKRGRGVEPAEEAPWNLFRLTLSRAGLLRGDLQ